MKHRQMFKLLSFMIIEIISSSMSCIKQNKAILRRARSKSKSFAAELLSVCEPSGSTISIISIPSPVDEATNDSSISSQPVNEGEREQHKLSSSSLLSYLKPFYLCVPPLLSSLLSKLSRGSPSLNIHFLLHPKQLFIHTSFLSLLLLSFSCFCDSDFEIFSFSNHFFLTPLYIFMFFSFPVFSITKVTPGTFFYLFRAMTIAVDCNSP